MTFFSISVYNSFTVYCCSFAFCLHCPVSVGVMPCFWLFQVSFPKVFVSTLSFNKVAHTESSVWEDLHYCFYNLSVTFQCAFLYISLLNLPDVSQTISRMLWLLPWWGFRNYKSFKFLVMFFEIYFDIDRIMKQHWFLLLPPFWKNDHFSACLLFCQLGHYLLGQPLSLLLLGEGLYWKPIYIDLFLLLLPAVPVIFRGWKECLFLLMRRMICKKNTHKSQSQNI